MSQAEETNREKRIRRARGHTDGFAKRPAKHPGDVEYMKSYRRGVERREKIDSGEIGPQE